MENIENEIVNLSCEIATLNATVERLTTLDETLLAMQAHNSPLYLHYHLLSSIREVVPKEERLFPA